MPLSKPQPRDHIHTREIRCRGFRRLDGLWDIEASLEDTKTYSFANLDRDGIASGEPIHAMRIRITLDENLVVQGAEAATDAGPFTICGDIAPVFQSLVGERIGPGWRKVVASKMAGVRGCTHLTELLLGPLSATAMLTVNAARSRREGRDGNRPAVIDSCHAFAGDGPIVARQWPEHARRKP
ncbi:MAG: DUF2889 domain-containing protein [Rhodospirillales bacterium]|nr:MAG: DUF2889 domain-containing protein [Rhodospirillales bacterium]